MCIYNRKICDSLLKKGAVVNKADIYRNTALIYAVKEELIEKIEWLLSKGCDPEIKNREGYTAFDYAQKSTNIEITNMFKRLEQKRQAKEIRLRKNEK